MSVKEKLSNAKDAVINFWDNHKDKIIVGGLLTGWAITCGIAHTNGDKQGFVRGYKRGFQDNNEYLYGAIHESEPELCNQVQDILNNSGDYTDRWIKQKTGK